MKPTRNRSFCVAAKQFVTAGRRRHQPGGQHQQITFAGKFLSGDHPEFARRHRPVHIFDDRERRIAHRGDGDAAHFDNRDGLVFAHVTR